MRASRRRIFMRWTACSLAIQATLPCSCNRLPRSNSVFGVKPDRRLQTAGTDIGSACAKGADFPVMRFRRDGKWVTPGLGRLGPCDPPAREHGMNRPASRGGRGYGGPEPLVLPLAVPAARGIECDGLWAGRWLAARSGRSRAGIPERARGGELDLEGVLVLKRPGDPSGRADREIGGAQDGPGGAQVGGGIQVGGRDALG